MGGPLVAAVRAAAQARFPRGARRSGEDRSLPADARALLVAYDAYPKARVHLLILPRQPLAGPKHLTSEHVPLLTHMMSLAEWLVVALAHAHPNSSPLRVGFHAVPTMRQLHLHVISADLDSPCLKNKKHYNSFATDFFVPPERWLAQLKELGRVVVDDHAEEAKLKRDLKCYLTGRALKNIPELKAYLGSPAYAAALDKERSQGPQSHRVAA
eukprot:scaffold97763_cov33-Tisochrysis_lutea.AAC.1